jgi:hypothetical protein
MFFIVIFDMLFFHFNVKETKNKPLSDHMPGSEESWSNRKKYKKNIQATLTPVHPQDEKELKLIGNEEV